MEKEGNVGIKIKYISLLKTSYLKKFYFFILTRLKETKKHTNFFLSDK